MDQDLTTNQFWADIIAAHITQEPPSGAKTAREFAEELDKSVPHARTILAGYVKSGVMECGTFRRPEDGRCVSYYWQRIQGVGEFAP